LRHAVDVDAVQRRAGRDADRFEVLLDDGCALDLLRLLNDQPRQVERVVAVVVAAVPELRELLEQVRVGVAANADRAQGDLAIPHLRRQTWVIAARCFAVGEQNDVFDLGVDRRQPVVRHLQCWVDLGAAARLHLRDGCLDHSQVSRWRGRDDPAGLVFEGDDPDLVVLAE
jgi:hypothetical protein